MCVFYPKSVLLASACSWPTICHRCRPYSFVCVCVSVWVCLHTYRNICPLSALYLSITILKVSIMLARNYLVLLISLLIQQNVLKVNKQSLAFLLVFFLCVFILSTLPPDYPLPQCTQAARFVHVYVCVCCSVTATVQSMTQKDVLSHFREVLSRRFLFCKHWRRRNSVSHCRPRWRHRRSRRCHRHYSLLPTSDH